MDIAQVSTGLSQMNMSSQVNIKVAKMGLDLAQQTGNQITEMVKSLDIPANPQVGNVVDVRL